MNRLIRVLPLALLLYIATGAKAQTSGESGTADTTLYSSIDIPPSYKGGDKGFGKYLAKKLKYPMIARQKFIQGRVILIFTVEKDGEVTNVFVKVGVSPEIDAEAIRLLRESPKWMPGTLNGKAVRTLMHVPLDFKLDD